MEINYNYAKLTQIKNLSAIWIIPLLTLFIATCVMIYQLVHLGPEIILITDNGRGIEEGRTIIKCHNVSVGLVKEVSISKDLNHVEIKVRLKSGMKYLLHKDSIFWIVKPQMKHEGINGLSNLLSGTYIVLYPGSKDVALKKYTLMNDIPTILPHVKGTRILLESKKSEKLFNGDPVFFHGYKVGIIENSKFNSDTYKMTYQLFIEEPYNHLVNDKICFWKNSSIDAGLSTSSMRIEIGSINTLLNNSISFDNTVGCFSGKYIANKKLFYLFDNQDSMKETINKNFINYVLLFSSSIRGLKVGAPVEFRGIRIGTVSEVPFLKAITKQKSNYNYYNIPVLIQIEPRRFFDKLGKNFILEKYLHKNKNNRIYAILKNNNFISQSTYIDLDFNNSESMINKTETVLGYKTIPTISSNFNDIQQKIILFLNKIDKLPLSGVIMKSNKTLKEAEKIIKDFSLIMDQVNRMLQNPITTHLPQDMHKVLINLNEIIKEIQPGSLLYDKLINNMQILNQVLNELKLIIKTLNISSNALIYKPKLEKDPEPKRIQR
ncbi:intermembrane transport protein PqiB [Candidatus Pantoea edessiphila]|uniref:Paraquat-inducible protein B n=1 Tax=Candidatus Pantoea edessiphila TaxID=2044610 RepID=A0A2P5SX19_9GAMM|nr:intermembrane transport protein PqiB [Candidatus Pantoea edessiphila]PPI86852.1 paraquat-inducible protein B [Candidatus Pantoea edessiphila]